VEIKAKRFSYPFAFAEEKSISSGNTNSFIVKSKTLL
jgi:hypothetical protein